jgi:Fic family protein
MAELHKYPGAMEPMFPSLGDNILAEKAFEISRLSGTLYGRLPKQTCEAIAQIVRFANCYYSNLIEGHTTHPADIERAMNGDYALEPKKKDLQVEARAHVTVQESLEQKLSNEPESNPYSLEFLCWIHHEFYKNLPESFRIVRHPRTGKEHVVKPGEIRETNVVVGTHCAPEASSVKEFLARFNSVYSNPKITPQRHLVAIAASHHRLAWIHPFLDGNGRVVRLFSHALAIKHGIGGHGLWTISRGLARTKDQYYAQLHQADMPRVNDLDVA